MQRRKFIGGLTVAALLPLPAVVGSSDVDQWFVRQAQANTFTEEDTLVERVAKLNALMGTDYVLDVEYPKEWERQTPPVHKDELLHARRSQLVDDPRHPSRWRAYLKRNGEHWTGSMQPIEFLHWTAQVALGYRLAKVQGL